ncbi:MAG: hypothetical protein F7C82_06370 [Desulfurococcales archaeon]|nr:hypothetical protein [Desulfurococcales archaeon]
MANQLYDYLCAGFRDVCVEGPAGLGKTGAVWAAVATYAEENKLRILWLTRTSSQVSKIAKETGCLPVYGRKTLCIHETVKLVELRRFNAACRATRLAGRCIYYPGRPRAVSAKTVGELKEIGKSIMTCPYECVSVSMVNAKGIVATHRQLSTMAWIFSKWNWAKEKTVAIIDEAQNILKDALSMVRDSISLLTLRKAAKEASRYGFGSIAEQLAEAAEYYESRLADDGEIEVDDRLPDIDDLIVAAEEVQDMKLRDNIVPASHILSVADFKTLLSGKRPLLVREAGRYRLEALADPKDELNKVYEGWAATVTLSATLDTALLERTTGRDFVLLRAGWPFLENALRAVIVKGLSTKFEKRDERLYDDCAWIVKLGERLGRTIVFAPSYEVLAKVTSRLSGNYLVEKPSMSQEEIEAMISSYGASSKVLMTVFNSRTAE